jgi:hypothetical protein
MSQVFWNKLDAALELLFFDLPEVIQADFESQTGGISARAQAFARREHFVARVGDPEVVMKLFRHANLQATARYFRVVEVRL